MKKFKKKKKQKEAKIISIALILLIVIFYFLPFSKRVEPPEAKFTTLYFVGDMMLTRGVKASVDKNFGGDYSKLFENLGELKEADILFGNFEGDVSDKGNNVGSIYSFRMDPKVLPIIKEAGFDIVSFANNHIGDWNMTAFKDSLSRLAQNGILKTGAGVNKEDAENPIVIEKNGIKFGFIGFSDVGPNWMEVKTATPGILLASDPKLKEIIQNAKTKCDVLIVSFHWGEEYKLVHNKRQETLAKKAIDNGADMIIGHHPHVMEDTSVYKGKPIVYSLGNFIFDQYFSKDTMQGMLFSATFDGKNLVETSKRIITLNTKYQPEGIFKIKEKSKITPACPGPKKEYDDMILLDIGQKIGLPDITYIPKNLTEVNTDGSIRRGVCLIRSALDAFQLLIKSAKKDGVVIKASSGFRSYDIQKILYTNALKTDGGDISTSVAKPGYSEHQLGTTVDLTGTSVNFISTADNFDLTPEDLWLEKNAYMYGFVQSYPKDKESITGYNYEPWHYRYVGTEKAKLIHESGLTITEFLK